MLEGLLATHGEEKARGKGGGGGGGGVRYGGCKEAVERMGIKEAKRDGRSKAGSHN